MNPRDAIETWLAQLAPRERVMVIVCAIVVVLFGAWTLAIQPLFITYEELTERVEQKEAELANLQELAGRFKALAATGDGGPAISNADSIVVVIDRTTRNSQLDRYLKRNQPDGNTGVRIRFEGAPFDTLVQWLGELKSKYGMTMVTANFDEVESGRVNCSLVISRTGG
jgi:type II secretory pathway component PulM